MTHTPESQQAALKPCPFCGGEPEFRYLPKARGEIRADTTMAAIACKDPRCAYMTYSVTSHAIKRWNTRTPAPVDVSHAALAERAKWLRRYSPETLPIYHEIAAEIEAALRAHHAGGVSDTQKTLQRGGLREIIQEALTAKFDDGREEYLLHHGIIRAGFTQPVNATKNYENRLIEALRAAGIGAGVVENDK